MNILSSVQNLRLVDQLVSSAPLLTPSSPHKTRKAILLEDSLTSLPINGKSGQEDSRDSSKSVLQKFDELVFESSSLPVDPRILLISTILFILFLLLLYLLLCRFRAKRNLQPSDRLLHTSSRSLGSRLLHYLCCWRNFYYTKHHSLTILTGGAGKSAPNRVSSNSGSLSINRFRIFQRRIIELPTKTGKLPQIRISVSSCGSADRVPSRMSNVSSMAPTWLDKRWSINTTTPQSPGSPCSLSSAFKEPLLRTGSDNSGKKPSCQRHRHVSGFWHRLSSTSSHNTTNGYRSSITSYCSSSTQENNTNYCTTTGPVTPTSANGTVSIRQNQFLFPFAMDKLGDGNQLEDDREIDNRSVLHYELGFYEKTLSSCFRGSLTFQVRYDFIHRVLMLHVMRATHLPSQDGAPDPYIKMYCLPERRQHCKTRIFKKSSEAEFNEMFSFDVPYAQLANRMLQFTVYDFDRFTRHGLIGNVIMRDLFEKSDLYHWTEYTMQIVGNQEKNDFGDLLLYLGYLPTSKKLYVTVSKAYNLRPMDITGASDPYVRVEQILGSVGQRKRVKLRKTSIKRANLNPVYHECLEFDLPVEQIGETHLLVQVMDWDRIGRDDLLGCCVLGAESTTKEGRLQWEQTFQSITHILPPTQSEGKSSSMDEPAVGVTTTPDIPPDGANGLANDNPGLVAAIITNGTRETEENKLTKPVGTWHSILGEVPEGFRNIPKAKK